MTTEEEAKGPGERGGRTDPPADDATSEVEQGLHHLNRAIGGIVGRLLGERLTGIRVERDQPVFSARTDQLIERTGARVGRLLYVAGEGLKDHPDDPNQILARVARRGEAEVPVEPGDAPLSVGLRSLGGGLYRAAEHVLDQVAPRKGAAGAAGEE